MRRRVWLAALMAATLVGVAVTAVLGERPLKGTGGSVPLAAAGITLTVTPGARLTVVLAAPAEAATGDNFHVEAEVTNHGDGALAAGQAELLITAIDGPSDGLVVQKADRRLGNLKSGTKTARWLLKARAEGTYRLEAAAAATDPGSGHVFEARSQSVTVTVIADGRPASRNKAKADPAGDAEPAAGASLPDVAGDTEEDASVEDAAGSAEEDAAEIGSDTCAASECGGEDLLEVLY